jgi:uncharacterized protein (DUF4415 family)
VGGIAKVASPDSQLGQSIVSNWKTDMSRRPEWLFTHCGLKALTFCPLPRSSRLEAQRGGLLSDEAISRLIEEAVRREAGKRLLDAMARLREANVPPLTEEVGVRRPLHAPTKERITIRLSPDVLQSIRATGAGWKNRVDAALKDWLKKHSPA